MKKWLPIALCCLPGIAAIAILGIGGVAFGASLSGLLGLGLVVLAMLACPLSMALMMRRQKAAGHSQSMADCCLPRQETTKPTERLTVLRERREALERELTELRAKV
jgi:hypothetical protein